MTALEADAERKLRKGDWQRLGPKPLLITTLHHASHSFHKEREREMENREKRWNEIRREAGKS